MSWPNGVTLITGTVGDSLGASGESADRLYVAVAPVFGEGVHRLLHADTGTVWDDRAVVVSGSPTLFVQVPVVDQPGFVDGAGNEVTGWYYVVEVISRSGRRSSRWSYDWQPVTADGSSVDLDTLGDGVAVTDPTVIYAPARDALAAREAAAEAVAAASEAEGSVTAIAGYATAAAGSAAAADLSAQTAADSVTDALAAASEAEGSANAAADSADLASGSATAASGSASAAAGSASTAAGSATAAAGSASAAATSATSAGSDATVAARISDPTSSTRAVLNNAFVRHIVPLTAALGGTDVAAEIAAAFADPDVTEVRVKSPGASYYPISADVVVPAGKRLTNAHGATYRLIADVNGFDVKEDAILDGGKIETYLFDGYSHAAVILRGTATFGTSNVLTMVRNVRIRGKSGNVAGVHIGEGYGILLDSGTTGGNRISFAQFENIHIRGTSTAIAVLSRTPTSGVTWVNGNGFRGITISQPRRGVDLIRDATGAAVTANYIDFQLQTGTGLESAYYDNGRGNVTHHTIWDYDLDSNVGDGTAVLTAADDRITTPSAHGLVVDQSVRFQTVTSATGLNPSVVYFITSVPTSTSFTVAEERGGTTIDLLADGTATGLVSIRMAAYPMTLTERSQEGEVYTNLASYYIDNKGTNQVFSTSAVGRTGARFVGRVNGSSHLAKYGDQDDWLAWAIKRGVAVTQTAGTAPTGALDNLFDLNAANTCLFDGGPNVLEIDWTTGQRPSSLMLLFANGKYPTAVTVEAYRSGAWNTAYSTTANVQTSVSVGNFSPYNFQITKIRVTFSGLAPGKTAVEFERLAMFEQREAGNAYQSKATTRLVRKTTSTIRNNTGTPAADPDLAMPVEANAVYEVSGLLHYTGTTTGDLLLSWSIPSGGSALYWGAPGLRLAATLQNDTVNMSSYASATSTHQLGAVGISNRALAQLRGLLVVGSTAGTISLKWSQNFAEVSDLTMLAGSYLKLEKVG